MVAVRAQFKGRPVHRLHQLELMSPTVGSNPTAAIA
jgi:hypothetical protein